MAKDMFDQVKFIAGLAVFAYALYSIWGVKKAGITPIGFGLPPLSDFGLGGGGSPAVRDTPNCSEATNECACPNGDVFQMGPARTCADCTIECAKRGGGGAAPAESMMGYFYGQNIRDHGLGLQLTGWEKSDAINRLTVA